jgi:23S rRNA maturation mini-RNase III
MVQAYNFLASWQLFPEKSVYEKGMPARSGNYRIESINHQQELSIQINRVTLDNEALFSQYEIKPDAEIRPMTDKTLADAIRAEILNASTIEIDFYRDEKIILKIRKEILPNGYLKITQQLIEKDGELFRNIDIYHKQLSVLPYASSVNSVVVKPTEEGVIRHKALQAMEEQTNMQLDQIRQQIELLARQAQEIRKRRELSLMVYEAKLNFQPVIGHLYFLYQKNDDCHVLSMISPAEWGGNGPFKQFVAAVKLLADHTWVELTAEEGF